MLVLYSMLLFNEVNILNLSLLKSFKISFYISELSYEGLNFFMCLSKIIIIKKT